MRLPRIDSLLLRAEYTFHFIVHCIDGRRANADQELANEWMPANAAVLPDSDTPHTIVPFKSSNLGSIKLELQVDEDRAAKQRIALDHEMEAPP